MPGKIDINDLPDEQVKFIIEEFIHFLREKAKKRDTRVKGKREGIRFASWPLGVKGGARRSEIYDYL